MIEVVLKIDGTTVKKTIETDETTLQEIEKVVEEMKSFASKIKHNQNLKYLQRHKEQIKKRRLQGISIEEGLRRDFFNYFGEPGTKKIFIKSLNSCVTVSNTTRILKQKTDQSVWAVSGAKAVHDLARKGEQFFKERLTSHAYKGEARVHNISARLPYETRRLQNEVGRFHIVEPEVAYFAQRWLMQEWSKDDFEKRIEAYDIPPGKTGYIRPWAYSPKTNMLDLNEKVYVSPGGSAQLPIKKIGEAWLIDTVYDNGKSYRWY